MKKYYWRDGTERELVFPELDYLHYVVLGTFTDFIPEVSEPNLIKIFPNPASTTIQLDINLATKASKYPYTLLDYTGRIIQTGQVPNSTSSISIEHLPTGVYIMSIQLPNKKISKVFIVNR